MSPHALYLNKLFQSSFLTVSPSTWNISECISGWQTYPGIPLPTKVHHSSLNLLLVLCILIFLMHGWWHVTVTVGSLYFQVPKTMPLHSLWLTPLMSLCLYRLLLQEWSNNWIPNTLYSSRNNFSHLWLIPFCSMDSSLKYFILVGKKHFFWKCQVYLMALWLQMVDTQAEYITLISKYIYLASSQVCPPKVLYKATVVGCPGAVCILILIFLP